MNADLLAVRFLFASAGCLAAGLGMWGVTLLLRRYLPALAAQRSIWLLAQLAIAITFVVLMAPQARRLQVTPVFEIDAAEVVHARSIAAANETPDQSVKTGDGGRSWLATAAWIWLAAYVAGLMLALLRLWQGQRSVTHLVRIATPIAGRQSGPRILEIDAPVSPMLLGLLRPRLLLPRSLNDFDPLQQQLIVEHELTHWRRHDLWWLAAASLLSALFWFNPALRMLRAHLAWAQELGCDRDVLRGRPAAQRKAYAAALVAQLRLGRSGMGQALAFGGVGADTVAARLHLIRTPAGRTGWTRCAGLAGLGAAFAASLMLQPALAWHDDTASRRALDCTVMIDAASGEHLVEQGDCSTRVTPASTFNIVVSLMGYDSGVLRDAHSPVLPFKPGYADWIESWHTSTDPTSWIRNSTVWYAQQVAARIGAGAVRDYVARFDYGNRDLSGDADAPDGEMSAWFNGSLQVSPLEQAAFLRKVVRRELGLTPHAYDTSAQLLRLPALANGWQVYGKTGTAHGALPGGGEDPTRAYGWFVGWASKHGRTVVFARMVLQPRDPERAAGPALKQAFLRALPATLDRL
ncbi:class D beta-lactamase [Massilia sp. YIM B02443]|uniref:class D beta-lactamase n=1 Tax=Massilia sp. YIM B02443 TaxID=3050127 RepID=UPI0025B6F74D|nr:class D beta-lactamase [Massilia sp. YIM B02443]MDN4038769.1 class D beta-lactamase [Massilia sp. YIM B02443]